MINADMQKYEYYTYSGNNAYGQPTLDETVKGTVTIAIYTTSQSVQDNIKYLNATYIGLTLNSNINDTYVIKYGELKLKVLYVHNKGRYKQVFMSEI
jgi:hypothetical protein